MSLKVLVVPEDPTHNGSILKPLVEALFADLGKARAQVTVLTEPHVRGFDQAVAALRGGALERYRWWDVWLFFPDADRGTPKLLGELSSVVNHRLRELQGRAQLFTCAVQPELEIVACVAYGDDLGCSWQQAREHPQFKEAVFPAVLEKYGDHRRPHQGRDLLIEASLKPLSRTFQFCPELAELREEIKAFLATIATDIR